MFNFQGPMFLRNKIVSATNAEGPPVPIPNTEVKLCSGENTLRETVREDNSVLTQSWSGGIHSYDWMHNAKCRVQSYGENRNPRKEKRERIDTYYLLLLTSNLLLQTGGVAQLGEHLPCKQGVMGSNPIISTRNFHKRIANGNFTYYLFTITYSLAAYENR